MIAIVGSGIIGLAVAEFLSRTQPVIVVSNEHPLAGSPAAAANLAIKAQLYARDPHFALKLQARKMYKAWLQALLAEAQLPALSVEVKQPVEELSNFFREGVGLESFLTSELCNQQRTRVTQPQDELTQRGLGAQPIVQLNETTLCYQDEAWVDARFCLKLLKTVLLKRGVKFFEEDILKCGKSVEACKKHFAVHKFVFCTGAWTPKVLNHFHLKIPKSVRLTMGSVLVKNEGFDEVTQSFRDGTKEDMTLCEFRDVDQKVVLSGNRAQTFFSSSSVKIAAVNDDVQKALTEANEGLDALASRYLNRQYPTAEIRTGLRVGFGHQELVVETLNNDAILCSGAHKSGFLFAPVVGALVKELVSGNSDTN